MSQNESYGEILKFAIFRELEASRLYTALAKIVSNPEMSKVLKEFAKEELEHKNKLESVVMENGQVPPEDESSAPSIEEDIKPYADSLTEMDYRDILLLAIKKEEAAFRTYVGLAVHAAAGRSKDILLAIADDEVKHKSRFEVEYDRLTKKA